MTEGVHVCNNRSRRRNRSPTAPHATDTHLGCRAEARSRAVVSTRLDFCIWLQSLDRISVLHEFEGVREFQADRPRELRKALELDVRDRPSVKLVHRDCQHWHFRRALYRLLSRARPHTGNSARSEDPRRGHSPSDLSLSARVVVHRHRHGVEAFSRSGHRAGKGRPRLGLDQLQVRLGRQSSHDDLLRRDCGHLADVRFCDGDVSCRPRGVDGEILKAAQIDGASVYATYRRIVIPIMRPVFLSAIIVLAHMAIKSYDLVLSVTGKNPGGAAELPSTFMYSYTFTRNQMGVGSTSAVIMLMTIAAIMVPYLYSELREKRQ